MRIKIQKEIDHYKLMKKYGQKWLNYHYEKKNRTKKTSLSPPMRSITISTTTQPFVTFRKSNIIPNTKKEENKLPKQTIKEIPQNRIIKVSPKKEFRIPARLEKENASRKMNTQETSKSPLRGEEQKIFDWFETKYAHKPKLQPKMPTFGTNAPSNISPPITTSKPQESTDKSKKRQKSEITLRDQFPAFEYSSFMRDNLKDLLRPGEFQYDDNEIKEQEEDKSDMDPLSLKMTLMEKKMEELKNTKVLIRTLKDQTLILNDHNLTNKLTNLNKTLASQKNELEDILREIQVLKDNMDEQE